MCALSPTPLFSFFRWPLDDTISDEQHHMIRETKTPESFPQFLPSQPEIELNHSTSATAFTGDPNMVKKLNHNASERDRRKKINSLYSSLRSLLPEAYQMKKLSIPATVSKVLKYIPDLQHQVERLAQKKEDLLSKISKHEAVISQENQRKRTLHSSLSSVSASRLSDREVFFQISSYKPHKSPLSEILISLEKEGLVLVNSSSFESVGGRMIHNLHLQMEVTYKLECEALCEKLMPFCERSDSSFP